MSNLKKCLYCRNNNLEKYCYPGYYFLKTVPEDNKCYYCNNDLIDTVITTDEAWDIHNISLDISFLEAMIELKTKDPIEFQLKMQQFKIQTAQQNQTKAEEKSKVTCPQCGSKEIESGTRGFSFVTGFVGSGSPRNTCKRCGFKWKPNGWLEAINRDLHHN